MAAMPVVLDISSDEEGWGETGGGGGGVFSDNYDWISELLEADDSDDVVLVGETVQNKQRTKTSNFVSKPMANDLDDDCVVLDGDPDKPAVIENDSAGDSDDLFIVGEKGQVACRDYPHPRHLCAKFPFISTPHDSYCHQCHCYVCDLLAPCVHWGNGTSSIDHCHATDKEEFWKLERKNFRQGEKSQLSVSKLPHTGLSLQQSQTVQAPSFAMLQSHTLAQNQIIRPTTIRACSASPNFGVSNIRNQGRSQLSVNVMSRNKFDSHMVSQQLLNTHSSTIRKDRRHSPGHAGAQFINAPTIFKRTGSSSVALATTRSRYGSNSTHVTRYSRNLSPVAASKKNPTGWQDFSTGMTSERNACQTLCQQNTGGSFGSSGPILPQVSSYPNNSSAFVNPVPRQPQVTSQLNGGSNFVSSMPSQASTQLNTIGNFENSAPAQLHVSSHRSMDSSFVSTAPSEQQVFYQPTSTMNFSQDDFQSGNRSQIALDPCLSDFNTSWVPTTDQNNQQPLTDNSQVQCVGQAFDAPLIADFGPQFPVNTNAVSMDFHFANWIPENQPVSGSLEAPLQSGFNVYSPGPAQVDTGFFDF